MSVITEHFEYVSNNVPWCRDSMIVTTLDTLTSLLSGFTIFGILGNLAHELKTEVDEVIGSGGTGLAFISYPDAIAKTFMPQVKTTIILILYKP